MHLFRQKYYRQKLGLTYLLVQCTYSYIWYIFKLQLKIGIGQSPANQTDKFQISEYFLRVKL